MSRRLLLPGLLLCLAGAIILGLTRHPPNESHNDTYRPRETEARFTKSPIESTGKILGVGIGSSLKEAHEKLDPLRDPSSTDFRDKKRGGGKREKAYWRLRETEFSWIMAWTNNEGRIVRLSIAVSPEKPKPFEEVGDLSKAFTNREHVAIWNVPRPENLSYRLIARGPDRRATSIYLIATQLVQ